jgi:hypothetical protein
VVVVVLSLCHNFALHSGDETVTYMYLVFSIYEYTSFIVETEQQFCFNELFWSAGKLNKRESRNKITVFSCTVCSTRELSNLALCYNIKANINLCLRLEPEVKLNETCILIATTVTRDENICFNNLTCSCDKSLRMK